MTDQKKSDQTTSSEKPWGGRFSEPTDAFVERFTAAVGFDQRLYHHDITGSIAHATMLAKVGVLTDAERERKVEARDRKRDGKARDHKRGGTQAGRRGGPQG